MLESVALAQRRLGLAAVAALRDDILPVLQVGWVDRELHAEALAATIAADRPAVSLVDRVSFEFMRRRRLTRALAFDRHYAEQGFDVVAGRPD